MDKNMFGKSIASVLPGLENILLIHKTINFSHSSSHNLGAFWNLFSWRKKTNYLQWCLYSLTFSVIYFSSSLHVLPCSRVISKYLIFTTLSKSFTPESKTFSFRFFCSIAFHQEKSSYWSGNSSLSALSLIPLLRSNLELKKEFISEYF